MSEYLKSFQTAKNINHSCRVSLQSLALAFMETGNVTIALNLQDIADRLEVSSKFISEGVKLQLDESSVETYNGVGNILSALLNVSTKPEDEIIRE